MIGLFWSRATRDLLKSFGWGIAGTPSIRYSDEVAILAARPIASVSPTSRRDGSLALTVTDLHAFLFAGRGGTIVASGTEGPSPISSSGESASRGILPAHGWRITQSEVSSKNPAVAVSTRGQAMSNPAFKFDHVHIISNDPEASANWYVEMFGATITANTTARGAPQIFVDLGGMTILIRGQRPGEDPAAARPIRPFTDFSSHNTWGTDHFGFLYQGDLEAFCAELRGKGVSFPVELKTGVSGSRLCYVAAPDGVSIELMEC